MTLVTDKKINMHPALKEKLDLMIHRMEKKGFDNFLLIDGKEGFGKTTLAVQLCYYVSYETGRPFSVDNIYFRVKHLLEDMKKRDSWIFLLDEAELDLLSEQRGKMQMYFMQMLMAARKKNHFIVAIIPTIKKLKSFVVERAIGFIRVYSPDNLTRGYYAYYMEDAKNQLYEHWRKTGRLEYKKFYSFPGRFSNKFAEIIDVEAYDKKKDEAIASIGEEKEVIRARDKYDLKIRYRIYKILSEKKIEGLTMKRFAELLGIPREQISRWQYLPEKYPFLLESNSE